MENKLGISIIQIVREEYEMILLQSIFNSFITDFKNTPQFIAGMNWNW